MRRRKKSKEEEEEEEKGGRGGGRRRVNSLLDVNVRSTEQSHVRTKMNKNKMKTDEEREGEGKIKRLSIRYLHSEANKMYFIHEKSLIQFDSQF